MFQALNYARYVKNDPQNPKEAQIIEGKINNIILLLDVYT
jgi:hypothetical protein